MHWKWYSKKWKLLPLPSLDVQNELKIKACKKRAKLLNKEIEKIKFFLERYHKIFEKKNKQKIEELFKYINKILMISYYNSPFCFFKTTFISNYPITKYKFKHYKSVDLWFVLWSLIL